MAVFSFNRRTMGFAGGQGYFGAPQQRWCGACGQARTFRDRVTYRVFQVMWVFRFVSDRRYDCVCQTCGQGQLVAPPAQRWAGVAFMDRWGWAVGLTGFALAALAAVPSMLQMDLRQADRLAHPRVGDLYEVDLSPRSGGPARYTLMQVAGVTAGGVEVQMAEGALDNERAARDDLLHGPARRPGYFRADTVPLTLADLRRMYDGGEIVYVARP